MRRLILVVILCFFSLVAYAQAEETPGTGWQAFSAAYPTNLKPGGKGQIQLYVMNTGAKPSSGAITVTDTLPEGLTATNAGGMSFESATKILSPEEEEKELVLVNKQPQDRGGARWNCIGAGTSVVTCTSNPAFLPAQPEYYENHVEVATRLGIAVTVASGASERQPSSSSCELEPASTSCNRITVAGGGASSATSTSDPLTVSKSEPVFGFPAWDVWMSNAAGGADTQAGSHPYEFTTVNTFAELADGHEADGEARNIEATLPPGFFGDPGSSPRCTDTQLDAGECPVDSQIGIDGHGRAEAGSGGGLGTVLGSQVYNMVPPPGVADEFAFSLVGGKNVYFDSSPSSADGYRIVTHIDNIPEGNTDLNILTLWGVPAAASHDPQRCLITTNNPGSVNNGDLTQYCGQPPEASLKPFLTLPTSCGQPQEFTIHGLATWEDPNAEDTKTIFTHDDNDAPAGFTGCEQLTIEPKLSTVPDTSFADTPAGLTAEVTVPQENLTNPEGLVAATLKNTTVTLPPGLVVNPGQAAGLTACPAGPASTVPGDERYGDSLPAPGENGAEAKFNGPANCPDTSKVGTVEIQTPLLEGELEPALKGDVYILQSNPPELKLLIAANADGVNLKLVGNAHLCENAGETIERAGRTYTCAAPGQLITTFEETPELPFTSFKLSFSGGAQAALATPTQCGLYTTSSAFTPWTSPFGAEVLGTNSFEIDHGPGGGGCLPATLPFTPTLTAGATTDQAGGFTNFSLLLQRGDGQQRIEKLQFKAPEGLTGMLTGVPLCEEPQANAGTCTAASQIGHASVSSGPGPYPLVLPQPGDPEIPLYLTGPFNGTGGCTVGEAGCAPFGLSIVTHVIAGPFNLGTIVTRAKIEIDPHTAQITVTTNELPQLVDGVPTDLRLVDSVIDRPGFMINPTNCNPSSFSGTAYGTPPAGVSGPHAEAPISSHFQVGSCRGLEFAPKLAVSTKAQTSKADGASLTYKVTYPSAPQGSQSDIRYVKVELPEELPSRLTTLQKACTQTQFQANPAGCPSPSVIGHAKAIVPNIPVPIEGPVYFVSNGGEAFPNLVMVLQGYGVTIDLVGDTLIKNGVTSTTFNAVPDNPLTSFEINLPEGPYSALAANGNLCKPTKTETVKKRVKVKTHGKTETVTRRLKEQVATSIELPNEYIGQNGAQYKYTAPIQVTGCPKAKPAAKHHKKAKGKRKKK